MNPINWLVLLLFFNSTLGLTAVKLHFLYKEIIFTSDEVKSRAEARIISLKI